MQEEKGKVWKVSLYLLHIQIPVRVGFNARDPEEVWFGGRRRKI
jgi:hypothetical protein